MAFSFGYWTGVLEMLRRLILGLFVVCALLLSIIMWIVISNTGLKTITILVENFVPQLKITGINGRLSDGFCADNVDYQQSDGLQIKITHVCSSWFWRENTLFLSYLEANQTDIILPLKPNLLMNHLIFQILYYLLIFLCLLRD